MKFELYYCVLIIFFNCIFLLQERSVLNLTSHGLKLKNFPEGPMPEEVERIVLEFHLLDFAGCSLTMLDAPLLSAFVERWHPETSSFHLPFGGDDGNSG